MSVAKLDHGGGVHNAARRWGIPPHHWLDLSTGISPWSWPVPAVPEHVWRRLPEDDDGLVDICREVLALPSNADCLPVPGSQAALQTLPLLRPRCRVGVPAVGYAEHAQAWARAGHEVIPLAYDRIEATLATLDVLVCINPNNPTGKLTDSEMLLGWHQQLLKRGGWLVVDEAFLDATEGQSLAPLSDRAGLIVLRSLGKFYGLAGLRAGLVTATPDLCSQMAQRLGPWAVNHPARFVMAKALTDADWKQRQYQRITTAHQRLLTVLSDAGLQAEGDCGLFAWCKTDKANALAEALARQGVLVRLFPDVPALRFGLPGHDRGWAQLAAAL